MVFQGLDEGVGGRGEGVGELEGGVGRCCWGGVGRGGGEGGFFLFFWVVVFGDAEGGLEHVGLDDLELDGIGLGCGGGGGGGVRVGVLRGEGVVDFAEGVGELAPDVDPFGGTDVIVLEEEDEGRSFQERDVLAEELGAPVFGAAVGGRLGWWVADGRGRAR